MQFIVFSDFAMMLRLLYRTLPNWTDLKTSVQQSRIDGSAKKSIKTMTSEEESPTQVQQRNIREAEMLTSNLGEGGISHHEILSDISVLKELAIMQESMVINWFSIVYCIYLLKINVHLSNT